MKAKWYIVDALLLIIIFTGYMLIQNVDGIHDFFFPSMIVTMRNTDGSGEWQRLNVGETGYLNYDSIFSQKTIVLDGNCENEVSFRISDQQGNAIMCVTLSPGTECGLSALRRHTNYTVEIKTAGEHICVNFG